MPRPFEKLPPGASEFLYATARETGLTESKAALALGIPLDQLRRILRDHGPSKRLWDGALAVEREGLFQLFFDAAKTGDLQAAKFLLAARHGVTDKPAEPQQAQSAPVQVVLKLPGSFPMEHWQKVVEQPKYTPHQEPEPRQLPEIPE